MNRTIEQVELERRDRLGNVDLHIERYPYIEPQIPYRDGFERQIVRGTHSDNMLNQLFFSQKNINSIQNTIRGKIFELSHGKHKIGPQDENELVVIMRSIYLQRGRNLSSNFKEQIACLNNLVVGEAIPKILSQIQALERYYYDASHLYAANPIPHPINVSSAGTRINRSVTSLF